MGDKVKIGIISAALVMGTGLIGWQAWNTHQLQQQVREAAGQGEGGL